MRERDSAKHRIKADFAFTNHHEIREPLTTSVRSPRANKWRELLGYVTRCHLVCHVYSKSPFLLIWS